MNIKKLNEEIQSLLGEQNNRPNLASFIFKNYLNPDGQNYKGRETYASTLRSVLEEMERLYNKVKTNYAGGTTAQEQFKNHCENIWKHATVRDTLSLNSSTVKKQPGLADAIKSLHNYQAQLAKDLENLTKWNGEQWIEGINEEIEPLLEISSELRDKVLSRRKDNIEKANLKLQKTQALLNKQKEREELEQKLYNEIIDLGFIDVTGPRQKKEGTIMLQGTRSGRGYRLAKMGNYYIAIALNNFGKDTDGKPRKAHSNNGSKIDCLKWVIEDAKDHLNRMTNRNNPVLAKLKKLYPENIEEDLTAQYKDFVIESLEDLLRPEELDKYAGNLKISKRVTHWPNSSYIEYLIFGLYSEDSVISGRISVQANANGNNSTSEDIRAGFTRNPIGKIENRYNFNPNFIFSDIDTIINELVDDMKKARQQSIRASQAYIDYVRRTGDLS